jgi:hypothetical protein
VLDARSPFKKGWTPNLGTDTMAAFGVPHGGIEKKGGVIT